MKGVLVPMVVVDTPENKLLERCISGRKLNESPTRGRSGASQIVIQFLMSPRHVCHSTVWQLACKQETQAWRYHTNPSTWTPFDAVGKAREYVSCALVLCKHDSYTGVFPGNLSLVT